MIHERLVLGIDFSSDDVPSISVFSAPGNDFTCINILCDTEAIDIYNKLVGPKEEQK